MISPEADGINGTNGTILAVDAYENLIREQLHVLGHNTSDGLIRRPNAWLACTWSTLIT